MHAMSGAGLSPPGWVRRIPVLMLPVSVFPFAEPPQFVKEPERHITAEMEKVVAIPCQAKGELPNDPVPVVVLHLPCPYA